MNLYHGTNIVDGENILRDGFLFSIAFVKLRDEMRKRQIGEREIFSLFTDLGAILPIELSGGFDREKISGGVKNYCLSHGLNFKIYFREGAEFFPWEAMLDNRAGIHFFDDEDGYFYARSQAFSKCRSISYDKWENHPEGFVFEADFSHEAHRPRFCRPIKVSSLNRIHLFYENYETVQRISPLLRIVRIPFDAELYLPLRD